MAVHSKLMIEIWQWHNKQTLAPWWLSIRSWWQISVCGTVKKPCFPGDCILKPVTNIWQWRNKQTSVTLLSELVTNIWQCHNKQTSVTLLSRLVTNKPLPTRSRLHTSDCDTLNKSWPPVWLPTCSRCHTLGWSLLGRRNIHLGLRGMRTCSLAASLSSPVGPSGVCHDPSSPCCIERFQLIKERLQPCLNQSDLRSVRWLVTC